MTTDWRVGKFFLTYHPDKKPKHQGYVLAAAGEGMYEVGLFSWIDGGQTAGTKVQPLSYFDGADWFTTDRDLVVASARAMGHDVDKSVRFQQRMKEIDKKTAAAEPTEPTPASPRTPPQKKSGRRNIPAALRFKIFKRDHFLCTYCGKRPPDVQLELDHVVPVSKGGTDEESNLVTSCNVCNGGKSDTSLDS